ncbi:DNA translocase FtsK [Bacillus sp. JZ8]
MNQTTEDQLLAQWINRLLVDHFKTQKQENTEKLFIKISGLTTKNTYTLLQELKNNLSLLNSFYEPIIRTITPVRDFNEFAYRDHETSTWLRNNTKAGQSLILIINEMTPEAQSLENLFTIDESYLLTNSGLMSMYNVLAESGRVAAEEIEHVRKFIKVYQGICEPQLRSIVRFIVHLLNDSKPSVIDSIQKNLPYLNMFMDTKLKIGMDGKSRLRKNFALANLQIKEAQYEKIQNNLYSFIEQEEQSNWPDEIWKEKSVEDLTKEVLEFLDQTSNKFLFNDFEFVQKVADFKLGAMTIKDQIQEALNENKDNMDEEEIKSFQNGIDEVVANNNPEAIQDFIEEFEEELSSKSGVVKKLNRTVEKLLNPSVYRDIITALLKETFSLLEEERTHSNIQHSSFELNILTNKASENIVSTLKVYLNNFENVVPKIRFDATTLPSVDESSREKDVAFELKHFIENDYIGSRKFKITSLSNLEFFSMMQKVEQGTIPYIKNYAESEIDPLDVKEYIKNNVKNYISMKEELIEKHTLRFFDYLDKYLNHLNKLCKEGIFSLDVNELESETEDLLAEANTTSVVAKHLYQNINIIGVIDDFSNKQETTGVPVSRKLTILNPIRLISYLKRYEQLNDFIEQWCEYASQGNLEVEKLDQYLELTYKKVGNLAPRYFSVFEDETFLIENDECLGEGSFLINTKQASNTDYLSQELSEELVKVVKNYLEVYPYAKDGLDMLLLYCQGSDVVMKCIDAIFSKTKVNKMRLTVHSETAAKMHTQLNKWLQQNEDYTKADVNSKFPKIEINVIHGKNINEISQQIDKQMVDADLVVLADYFGQGDQVKYRYESVTPVDTNDWFGTVYKEPLNNEEAAKRISYASEHLPKTMQYFYSLQYVAQNNILPVYKDEVHLLKNLISITSHSQSSLIDFMHRKFNWSVILDRYLDKTLLIKTSGEANIIQYKPKVGKSNRFKLIVSSSKYIQKLSEQTTDFAYYDRLHRKLVSILKNEDISREVINEAVNKVKDISGSLVLKVIGRGKYAHEMLATYLSTQRRTVDSEHKLQIWSICDDLPWFSSNKRRPDLVLTTLSRQEDEINISFELLELKFINHNIFEKERFDALKQIKPGISLYNKLFNFEAEHLDTNHWKGELVQYFIEKSSYNPEHVELLKDLQHISLDKINVSVDGSVDVYCYTSNLTEYDFEQVENGVYVDTLDSNIKNYIYTRSYILDKLQANELSEPNYEELDELQTLSQALESTFSTDTEEISEEEAEQLQDETTEEDENSSSETSQNGEENIDVDGRLNSDHVYPEVQALLPIEGELNYEPWDNRVENLKDDYIRRLKRNFNQNDIHVNVKEAIIGSSVIRLVLTLPPDLTTTKVTSRTKDMQLWLGLNSEPHVFINNQGLNVDIVREEPDTVFFEKFMKLVREQEQANIKKTNLIAPLGLDPLNKVISMDFSSSLSPHLLTGGTTGSGKSVTLNSIILGMMCLYTPEQVQFMFIDPKKVEFTIYEEKQHTMDVITEIGEAVVVLQNMVEEMERRYTTFAREGVTNLEEYIEEVEIVLPRIVIVFDEFADFMTQDADMKKQVENTIMRLGQKARAAGIHLIVCTQNPKSDIINTNIRNNLGARLALRAADATASNIILDDSGAEKLAGKGDFLAKIQGTVERGKSPFLTPKVRRILLKYFSKSE